MMEDIQGKVFSDFNVPTSSDGSYGGRKNIVDKTKEHMNMKLNQQLLEVSDRLKSSKTKVALKVVGGVIQLVATLPLKPGDTHKQGKNAKQYKISLGIPASLDGLKTAEEEAYELGKLIARKTFAWTNKYLGIQAATKNNVTFAEFYEEFEKRYFSTRKRTIRSENSFYKMKSFYKKYFLKDIVINQGNLIEIVKATTNCSVRNTAITIARFTSKELSLDCDFSGLKLQSSPKKRNIPTDRDIVNSFNKFDEYVSKIRPSNKIKASLALKRCKLIFSLLAIYGLRPREVFNRPNLEWLISPENKHNTFKVHESNKTGYREVFPFVPEWIELFDLKNKESIAILSDYVDSEPNHKLLTARVSNFGFLLSSYGIDFTPYDLRHACAIRAHLQGVPIKAAADNLGHTVEIHTKVYQQWFGLENRRKAFDAAFSEQDELDLIKDENATLRKRVAELELEISRLRLLKQMK